MNKKHLYNSKYFNKRFNKEALYKNKYFIKINKKVLYKNIYFDKNSKFKIQNLDLLEMLNLKNYIFILIFII